MNISQAAEQSGLSKKTIRYYESIDLVNPASRETNGYRVYGQRQIKELRFVYQSRELGFTLDECRDLLSLYNNTSRKSSVVKAMTIDKIADIDLKISKLENIRTSLAELAEDCHGNDRAECPILDGLAGLPR